MFEMDEYPPEILVILFDAVNQLFDVALVQKAQHLLLELATALAGNDLHQFDALVDGFLDNAIKFRVDLLAAIVDVVQVEFEFCHSIIFLLRTLTASE